MEEPKGVIPILNTPFDNNSEVDKDDMLRQLNYALAQHPHGIGVNGEASECYNLTLEERQRILEWTMEETKGQIPVVVGVGTTDSTADSVALARHANEKGAAAVFSPPLIEGKTTPDAVYAHFKAINDAIDIPVIVQQHSVVIPDTVLKRLIEELENVKYIKEERPINNGQWITRDQLLSDKVQVFSIGVQIMDELQRGAIGMMPSCMGLTRYVKIFNSYMNGDIATAWAEWEPMLPLVTYRKQINAFSVTKEILHRKGIFKTIRMRGAGLPLDDMELKMLNRLMEQLGPPI